MIRYACDRCGASLGANDPGRYIVKIEVFAAAGTLNFSDDDVTDASANLRQVVDELTRADPDEIENQTYRSFRFDLCDRCHRDYLSQPLPAQSPDGHPAS